MVSARELRNISFSSAAQEARKKKIESEEKLNQGNLAAYGEKLQGQVYFLIQIIEPKLFEAARRGETFVDIDVPVGECFPEDVREELRKFFGHEDRKIRTGLMHPKPDGTYSVSFRWEDDYESEK